MFVQTYPTFMELDTCIADMNLRCGSFPTEYQLYLCGKLLFIGVLRRRTNLVGTGVHDCPLCKIS